MLGSPLGWGEVGGDQSSSLPNRIELRPSPPLGASGCVSGTVCTPTSLQKLPEAEGSGRADTAVLLAAGLPTASAVACQGSINFPLEESVSAEAFVPAKNLRSGRGQGWEDASPS